MADVEVNQGGGGGRSSWAWALVIIVIVLVVGFLVYTGAFNRDKNVNIKVDTPAAGSGTST